MCSQLTRDSPRAQMDLSSGINAFWAEYLSHSDRESTAPLYEAFHFGDNQRVADLLAELVLCGKKCATASLLWKYEADGKRPPRPGDMSVVTNWEAMPLCVIETSQVDVSAFEDVDKVFAAAEGEADLTLKHWRRVHWAYFGQQCEELGRERSLSMPVVCERFSVIYRRDKSDSDDHWFDLF